jgi:hypothetical protein
MAFDCQKLLDGYLWHWLLTHNTNDRRGCKG